MFIICREAPCCNCAAPHNTPTKQNTNKHTHHARDAEADEARARQQVDAALARRDGVLADELHKELALRRRQHVRLRVVSVLRSSGGVTAAAAAAAAGRTTTATTGVARQQRLLDAAASVHLFQAHERARARRGDGKVRDPARAAVVLAPRGVVPLDARPGAGLALDRPDVAHRRLFSRDQHARAGLDWNGAILVGQALARGRRAHVCCVVAIGFGR